MGTIVTKCKRNDDYNFASSGDGFEVRSVANGKDTSIIGVSVIVPTAKLKYANQLICPS